MSDSVPFSGPSLGSYLIAPQILCQPMRRNGIISTAFSASLAGVCLKDLHNACVLTGGSRRQRTDCRSLLCPDARDVIGEIQYLIVADRGHDLGHRRVVAMAGIVFIAAQRLHQVILALVGDVGHVLLAGKSRGVAKV